ncbi:MAG: transposase [Desulfosarcina sp.]|nr:transposase [Desulfosarcina sp.]
MLADVESRAQTELAAAKLAHADETGIDIGGKRHRLHGLSNDQWTCYYPHVKRGTDAVVGKSVGTRRPSVGPADERVAGND